MKSPLLSLLFSLVLAAVACASGPGWSDDFEASKAKAASEKKLLFLDFTGSDWCGACIAINREVFSKEEFQKFAAENLVLVELDFPVKKKISDKVREQNEALQKKFVVEGYPTLIVLNPDGKLVAKWEGFSPRFFEELKAKVAAAKK